jgi:hypothetical protein
VPHRVVCLSHLHPNDSTKTLTNPTHRYPPNTPEKQKDLGAFFGKNPPSGVAQALPGFVDTLKAKHPEIKSWGILGVS